MFLLLRQVFGIASSGPRIKEHMCAICEAYGILRTAFSATKPDAEQIMSEVIPLGGGTLLDSQDPLFVSRASSLGLATPIIQVLGIEFFDF